VRACLFILISVIGIEPTYAATTQPEITTQAFYGWVLSHPATSLPSPEERKQLAAFMDPAFIDLLRQTSAAEQHCIAMTPIGNKGNIFEGNLFVGNYEGATEVAYGATRRKGKIAYVTGAFPKVTNMGPLPGVIDWNSGSTGVVGGSATSLCVQLNHSRLS
jgi:hypothetical protein